MRTVKELEQALFELAPAYMKEEWDNVGLLCGHEDAAVSRVLVALDPFLPVAREAVEKDAQLLVTHHPLIFKAMKKINDQDFIGRRVLRMIQADLSCYAMHTNFDSAPGCMADLAAGRLGLTECQVLEPEGELEGSVYGIGKAGKLAVPLTLRELAAKVKEAFGLPFVLVYGDLESDLLLTDCAVSPGSGGSMIEAALGLKAQVLVTGDIGHHKRAALPHPYHAQNRGQCGKMIVRNIGLCLADHGDQR